MLLSITPVVGVLDSTFGSAGLVSGYKLSRIQSDGTILADPQAGGATVVLNPDGSVLGPYTPPAHPPVTFVVFPSYDLNSSSVTRHNPDGTLDSTFGNNGTVTDFISGTGLSFFHPRSIRTVGSTILLAGDAGTSNSTFFAIERLDSSGHIDQTFGTKGVAAGPTISGSPVVNFLRTSASDDIYVGAKIAGAPTLLHFGAAGNYISQFTAPAAPDGDGGNSLAFQSDGKVVFLAGRDATTESLFRLNSNLTPDLTFGVAGNLVISPPIGLAATRIHPYTLQIGPDGRIFVSAVFDVTGQPQQSDTYAVIGLSVLGLSTISGQVYTTATATTSATPMMVHPDAAISGRAPLAYWQVYADLNNNGVFDPGEPATFSDKNGSYRLSGLAAGTYHIREIPQGGWAPSGSGEHVVTLAADQAASGDDFSNQREALVTGAVVLDSNNDGKDTSSDSGLEDWRVFADLNGDGAWQSSEPSAVTDAHGQYQLTLPAGTYQIREQPQDGYHLSETSPGADQVKVSNGQTVTVNDFLNAVGNNSTSTDKNPPPTSGNSNPPSSGGTTPPGGSEQSSSSNPPTTGSSNPPPVTGTASSGTTDLVTLIAQDRQSLTDARQQHIVMLRQLQATIHADSLAMKAALHQVHSLRHSSSSSSDSTLADALAEFQRLQQQVRSDQQNLISFRRTDLSGIFAARQKLGSDLKAWTASRHRAK